MAQHTDQDFDPDKNDPGQALERPNASEQESFDGPHGPITLDNAPPPTDTESNSTHSSSHPDEEENPLKHCLVGRDIAIVEESVQIQTIMRSMLRQSDVRHIRLFSGLKVASKGLRQFTPDLIVVEWRTEPHRTADFLAWLKSDACKRLNDVPVVVTLFLPTESTIDKIRAAGCDYIVAKPMSQKRFLNKCQLAIYPYLEKKAQADAA